MKSKLLIRIATGFVLFFAAGHTIGHLTRHDVTDEKALEVQKMMMDYKFDMFGSMRSYDENYTGMSLNLIFTLVSMALLLWIISTDAVSNALKSILILPIALCLLGFAFTSYQYFFIAPTVSCFLAFFLLILAYFRLKTEK